VLGASVVHSGWRAWTARQPPEDAGELTEAVGAPDAGATGNPVGNHHRLLWLPGKPRRSLDPKAADGRDTRQEEGSMAIEQAQMQEYAKQWGQLVARAWGDEAFKRRLLAAPAAALAEQGIQFPPGVEVRAVENTDRVLYLTLPPKPSVELSDEQLDAVAGGSLTALSTIFP
jgi:hypothetical protein